MKTLAVLVLAGASLAACSGDTSLSSAQVSWCTENSATVDDAASDLGLMDLVDTWYDTEGDGLESSGEPKVTDRNIEVSEDLNRRNAEDGDALFDELFAAYLEHPDGKEACRAAFAGES